MRAIVKIGVRRQGRVPDHAGPRKEIAARAIDVPERFVEKQLVVAVSVTEIKRALYLADARNDGLDTVEFTVDFEEDE